MPGGWHIEHGVRERTDGSGRHLMVRLGGQGVPGRWAEPNLRAFPTDS